MSVARSVDVGGVRHRARIDGVSEVIDAKVLRISDPRWCDLSWARWTCDECVRILVCGSLSEEIRMLGRLKPAKVACAVCDAVGECENAMTPEQVERTKALRVQRGAEPWVK